MVLLKAYEMKTYKIRVTRADIKNGHPQEASDCPVFLAMNRKLKNVEAVSGSGATLFDGKYFYEIPMPGNAADWINRFDNDESVKPFSFTLKVPLLLTQYPVG